MDRPARTGTPIEDTGDGIDASNARHAEDAARVGIDETVGLLHTNDAAALERLRSLDDRQLNRPAPFGPEGGRPLTFEQLAGAVVRYIHHAQNAVKQ